MWRYFESPGLGLLVAGVGFAIAGFWSDGLFLDWTTGHTMSVDEALCHPRPAAHFLGGRMAFSIASIFLTILVARSTPPNWLWFKPWMKLTVIASMVVFLASGMVLTTRRITRGLRYTPDGTPIEDELSPAAKAQP
jgi:hypothetical protein